MSRVGEVVVELSRLQVVVAEPRPDICGICGRHLFARYGVKVSASLRVDGALRASRCHYHCAEFAALEAAERGRVATVTYSCGKTDRVVRPENFHGRRSRLNTPLRSAR